MKIKIILPNRQTRLYNECIPINIQDVKHMVPDSICDFIYLEDCLDYVPNRQHYLELIVQKLKYDGKLIVEGNDLTDIVYRLHGGLHLNVDNIQQYLYNGRQSISNLPTMKELLRMYGLTIVLSKLVNWSYTITAKRPFPNYENKNNCTRDTNTI